MVILKLDKLLDKLELSMYQLHKMTGIRSNTISDMCQNKTKTINIENLDKICNVLNCKLEDILEYVENQR